jgi:phenylalanyl-tRNA synthetase beta chain
MRRPARNWSPSGLMMRSFVRATRSALEKVGVRSINNVVDVTNYVMLETGQPLHAFDHHLVAKGADGRPTIVVRRAGEGEKFTTLDEQERTLAADMLLIADEQKGIALAGVMGGRNTEINDQTTDVLLESAWFHPSNIRRTSKALTLRSESSYRFERGADIGITDWASRRAAQLILETAGGRLATGVVDAYPQPVEPRRITLRHHKVNELLGVPLKPEEIDYFLGQLGLKTVGRKVRPVGDDAPPEQVTFEVPTFRVDLKREIDLVEEVARLYGVDKIPSTPPRGAIGSNACDAVHDHLAEARRILSGLGLNEAQGQTLVSDASAALVAARETLVPLANPLSSDMNVLRPSLLPGLLDALRHNVNRKEYDVALFELGRVFRSAAVVPSPDLKDKQNRQQDAGGTLGEERHVAIALTGQRALPFWSGTDRDARCDLADLKGAVEEFLELFGVRGVGFTRRAQPTSLFIESAELRLGKNVLGQVGQLLPPLARRYDLRDAVLLAELNLDLLLARRRPEKSFKPLPQFPAIRRDVAMLVDEGVTHDAVLSAVKQAKAPFLESVDLFDVFRGQHVPGGQKSVAYAFTYRDAARTLTDAEANAAHEKVVEQLKTRLGAVVR